MWHSRLTKWASPRLYHEDTAQFACKWREPVHWDNAERPRDRKINIYQASEASCMEEPECAKVVAWTGRPRCYQKSRNAQRWRLGLGVLDVITLDCVPMASLKEPECAKMATWTGRPRCYHAWLCSHGFVDRPKVNTKAISSVVSRRRHAAPAIPFPVSFLDELRRGFPPSSLIVRSMECSSEEWNISQLLLQKTQIFYLVNNLNIIGDPAICM